MQTSPDIVGHGDEEHYIVVDDLMMINMKYNDGIQIETPSHDGTSNQTINHKLPINEAHIPPSK